MLRALREQNRILAGNKENRVIRANKGVTEALAKEYIRDYHKDINKARDVEVKLTRQLAAKEQALKGYKNTIWI